MQNYFEFLMKQLLSCGTNCNQTKESVTEYIEEKQITIEKFFAACFERESRSRK